MKPVLMLVCVTLSTAPAIARDRRPCRETRGAAAAARLVDRCERASMATHPPCNASNRCELIVGEIVRSCALMTIDKPGFCAAPAQ